MVFPQSATGPYVLHFDFLLSTQDGAHGRLGASSGERCPDPDGVVKLEVAAATLRGRGPQVRSSLIFPDARIQSPASRPLKPIARSDERGYMRTSYRARSSTAATRRFNVVPSFGFLRFAALLILPWLVGSPFARSALASELPCRGTFIRPGQAIQSVINAHGAGTTFCLRRGSYVIRSAWRPKARQRFVAVERRKAILTGKGVSGSFAFNGNGVAGVELRGLVVRNFAPPRVGGYAAIKAATGWRIIDNRIGPNRNLGLYHEADTVVRGNRIQGNTIAGVGGFRAHRSLILNNQISYNGRSRVFGSATGGKWARSIGIVVRGNYFHHNWDNALWLDGDNLNALVEDNIVADNFGKGIHYEVSCSAQIRDNIVKRNPDAGIIVVASRDVDVGENIVMGNGDGIQVSHQNRTSGNQPGDNCRWVTGSISVHDNRVTMGRGSTGLWTWQVSDPSTIFTDGRVRFFRNHYRVAAQLDRPFLWANGARSWTGWRSYGQDLDGTFQRF